MTSSDLALGMDSERWGEGIEMLKPLKGLNVVEAELNSQLAASLE